MSLAMIPLPVQRLLLSCTVVLVLLLPSSLLAIHEAADDAVVVVLLGFLNYGRDIKVVLPALYSQDVLSTLAWALHALLALHLADAGEPW